MRVIAGATRGHHLKSVKGKALRPTSDLVRGAIFSMLESLNVNWSRVLDLYAGTGALGIEALSRGAKWTDFVEQNPKHCSIIQENLKNTGLSERAHVYCTSVRRAISFLAQKYGIIFMDPPYNDPDAPSTLEMVASSSLVGEGSVLVFEHSRRWPVNTVYGQLKLIKDRRHGDTCISIFG